MLRILTDIFMLKSAVCAFNLDCLYSVHCTLMSIQFKIIVDNKKVTRKTRIVSIGNGCPHFFTFSQN